MTVLPPFAGISQLLHDGAVIPFLGAGVNTRPLQAPGWTRGAPFLPRGAELARALADASSFPSQDARDRSDLAKVASYGVDSLGRAWLRRRLREIFDTDYEPCDIHCYLASITRPLLIVTTNYDDLTERAFKRAGKPYDLVVHPTDNDDYAASVLWTRYGEAPTPVRPNLLHIDLEKTTVIYKMHGTVHRETSGVSSELDSYVVTEDDYVDFLSRMTGQAAIPLSFIRHFQERQFLFLGYGLNDWNLRVILRNLRNVLPEIRPGDGDPPIRHTQEPSWAIQYKPSALEVALWSARKVKIYDISIDAFVRGMRSADVRRAET